MESMKPVTRALQTLAAIESESRELILAEAPSTGSTEIDAEIVPLVQKIEAGSIAEIEKMIGEMQEAKNFLQTEWERIQRETARYMKLAQTASASVEIIFETVRGWRESRPPRRQRIEIQAHSTPDRRLPRMMQYPDPAHCRRCGRNWPRSMGGLNHQRACRPLDKSRD